MKNKLRNNQGFTIVELVIVIAIIAILTAIGWVGYSGVTDRAKTAQVDSAVSNLRSYLDIYYAEQGSYPTSADVGGFETAKLPGGITTPSTAITTWSSDGKKVNLNYYRCNSTGYVIKYKYPDGVDKTEKVGTCTESEDTLTNLYN